MCLHFTECCLTKRLKFVINSKLFERHCPINIFRKKISAVKTKHMIQTNISRPLLMESKEFFEIFRRFRIRPVIGIKLPILACRISRFGGNALCCQTFITVLFFQTKNIGVEPHISAVARKRNVDRNLNSFLPAFVFYLLKLAVRNKLNERIKFNFVGELFF